MQFGYAHAIQQPEHTHPISTKGAPTATEKNSFFSLRGAVVGSLIVLVLAGGLAITSMLGLGMDRDEMPPTYTDPFGGAGALHQPTPNGAVVPWGFIAPPTN